MLFWGINLNLFLSCKTILSIKNWKYLDIILLDENIHKELNNYNNNPNTDNIIIIGFRNLLQSYTKISNNKNLNNIITCQLVDAINKNKNLKISDDNSSS